MTSEPASPRSLGSLLALNRTVGVVLLSVLFFGLGEQLWNPFFPAYLKAKINPEASGAASLGLSALLAVGAYACLRNLFESFCYVGGGQLTARLGDRGSLLLFGCLSLAGYTLFLAWETPATAIVATLLIVGWEPLSVPVTFTTVGATVSKSGQGMAFALQSIQKRLPKIIGPLIAGWVIAAAMERYQSQAIGQVAGTRWLVWASLLLAVFSLAMQWCWMPHRQPPPVHLSPAAVVRQFPPTLRTLLLAEVFTRWCDWLVREFVVLYLLLVRNVEPTYVGLLFAVQNLTALATYLPIGRLTAVVGLQPFVGLTFVFFALFPLALALAPDGNGLLLAFIVYGLREIGEPARKALITSLLPEPIRAQGVGLYWGMRSLAVCWSPLVGAYFWHAHGPQTLLHVAFGLGCAGTACYYLLCRPNAASHTSP